MADLWPRLSELEIRVQAAFDAGTASPEHRADYWLSSLLASYLNAHRKTGTAAIAAKDLRPEWDWGSKEAAEVDEAASMKAAADRLLAWAIMASGGSHGG